MFVTDHAEQRIRSRVLDRALGQRIIERLEALPGTAGSVAIEAHRWVDAIVALREFPGFESNGDSLVVIARDGTVETVMLRRSWNQPFTPGALGVDRVERMASA